jgi:hypothetical protein
MPSIAKYTLLFILHCQLSNMKKIALLTFFASSAYFANAQQINSIKKSQVPPAVIKSYLSQNSTGNTDTIWETETVSIYKVRHKEENRDYVYEYKSDGTWLRTYTILGLDELPVLVVNQIRTSYPEYSIAKAMIELSSNGKLYAIELQRGQTKVTEYFLMSGKLYR